MLKIWTEWGTYPDIQNMRAQDYLTVFFQRDSQEPLICSITAESLKNPEMIIQNLGTIFSQMINESYPEYWTDEARALRRKADLLNELDKTNKFLESLEAK